MLKPSPFIIGLQVGKFGSFWKKLFQKFITVTHRWIGGQGYGGGFLPSKVAFVLPVHNRDFYSAVSGLAFLCGVGSHWLFGTKALGKDLVGVADS